MIPFKCQHRYFVYHGIVDFRKSFDGLFGIIKHIMESNTYTDIGEFEGKMNLPNGSTFPAEHKEVFLIEMDLFGNIIRSESSNTNGVAEVKSVIKTEDGQLVLMIQFKGENFKLGSQEFFGSQLDCTLAFIQLKCSAGGIPIIQDKSRVSRKISKNIISRIYPNPVNHALSIEYYCQNNSVLRIIVKDVMGRIVSHYTINNLTQGYRTESINLSAIASGLYILDIYDEEGIIFTHKIIKD